MNNYNDNKNNINDKNNDNKNNMNGFFKRNKKVLKLNLGQIL